MKLAKHFAAAAMLSLASGTAFADPVILGHNYLTTNFTTTNGTFIAGSVNINGMVIKTLVAGCNSNALIEAVPPSGGTAIPILYCVGTSATLPQPVYLPAGWGVGWVSNTTAIGTLWSTYDLQ